MAQSSATTCKEQTFMESRDLGATRMPNCVQTLADAMEPTIPLPPHDPRL